MIEDVLAPVPEVFQVVARSGVQSRPVREEVADRGVLGHVGVAQREAREEIGHRGLPREGTLSDGGGDRGRRQRLRDRRDLEHRLRVDRIPFAHGLHPEAFGVHDLAAVDDGHGESGHACLREVVRDQVGQLRQSARDGIVDARRGQGDRIARRRVGRVDDHRLTAGVGDAPGEKEARRGDGGGGNEGSAGHGLSVSGGAGPLPLWRWTTREEHRPRSMAVNGMREDSRTRRR